jgi:hypothetical protein
MLQESPDSNSTYFSLDERHLSLFSRLEEHFALAPQRLFISLHRNLPAPLGHSSSKTGRILLLLLRTPCSCTFLFSLFSLVGLLSICIFCVFSNVRCWCRERDGTESNGFD